MFLLQILQIDVTIKEMSIEAARWRKTTSAIAEPRVYGRDDDKEKTVKFLFKQVQGLNLFQYIQPLT